MDDTVCTPLKLSNGDIVYVDKDNNIIIGSEDVKEIQNVIEFKKRMEKGT